MNFSFAQYAFNYTFEFIDAIKGNYEDAYIDVTIYDFDILNESEESVISQDAVYILFLEKSDSLFHGVDYTLCSGLCIKANENDILQVYQRGRPIDADFDTINELADKIAGIVENIECNNEESVSGAKYITSGNIAEIVGFSSYIVKAKAVEKTTPSLASEKIDEIKFRTIDTYKGSVSDTFFTIVYRGSAIIGEEYLLLLENIGGTAYILSSSNSIVPVRDENLFSEYMEYID